MLLQLNWLRWIFLLFAHYYWSVIIHYRVVNCMQNRFYSENRRGSHFMPIFNTNLNIKCGIRFKFYFILNCHICQISTLSLEQVWKGPPHKFSISLYKKLVFIQMSQFSQSNHLHQCHDILHQIFAYWIGSMFSLYLYPCVVKRNNEFVSSLVHGEVILGFASHAVHLLVGVDLMRICFLFVAPITATNYLLKRSVNLTPFFGTQKLKPCPVVQQHSSAF